MPAARATALAALAALATLAPTACFVELDESLWQSRRADGATAQEPPLADTGDAVDAGPAADRDAGPVADDVGAASTDAGVDLTADDASPAADGRGSPDGAAAADLTADGEAPDSAPASDTSVPDTVPPADQGVTCSAVGVPTQCDPLTGGGCDTGTCYLSPVDTRCVCPEGTLPKGDTCTTTTECAPGLVCAASQTKGVCRELCDRKDPDCPNGEWCASITGVALFGICRK